MRCRLRNEYDQDDEEMPNLEAPLTAWSSWPRLKESEEYGCEFSESILQLQSVEDEVEMAPATLQSSTQVMDSLGKFYNCLKVKNKELAILISIVYMCQLWLEWAGFKMHVNTKLSNFKSVPHWLGSRRGWFQEASAATIGHATQCLIFFTCTRVRKRNDREVSVSDLLQYRHRKLQAEM